MAVDQFRLRSSVTDDDLRAWAESIDLGAYLATTYTGFFRRILVFERALIERRRGWITVSLDRPWTREERLSGAAMCGMPASLAS